MAVVPQALSIMIFDTGSLGGLDLTKQARLASRGAPGTLLSPPRQHTSFIYGFWDQTQVLELGDPIKESISCSTR